MQWLGTSKYTIFLTLLKFQNLWNLINVLIKNIWKYLFKCVLYIFKSSMGPKNLRCDIPNGTTQGWVCITISTLWW
jgi:hypothetical protein